MDSRTVTQSPTSSFSELDHTSISSSWLSCGKASNTVSMFDGDEDEIVWSLSSSQSSVGPQRRTTEEIGIIFESIADFAAQGIPPPDGDDFVLIGSRNSGRITRAPQQDTETGTINSITGSLANTSISNQNDTKDAAPRIVWSEECEEESLSTTKPQSATVVGSTKALSGRSGSKRKTRRGQSNKGATKNDKRRGELRPVVETTDGNSRPSPTPTLTPTPLKIKQPEPNTPEPQRKNSTGKTQSLEKKEKARKTDPQKELTAQADKLRVERSAKHKGAAERRNVEDGKRNLRDSEHGVIKDCVAPEPNKQTGQELLATAYDEAVKFMNNFVLYPHYYTSRISRLTFLQALIVELGLHSNPKAPLPGTLKAAQTFLRSHAFLNVRDYLAMRSEGLGALRSVMHPTKKSLVNELKRSKKSAKGIGGDTGRRAQIGWVKETGLTVLLVQCYGRG